MADAVIFAAAGAKVRSRTLTDGEGRANVAVPTGEDATLFFVPRTGAFGIHRVAKNDGRPLRVALSAASSSLLIRARTSTGAEMPPFSLLLRYDGTLVPLEIADAVASTQGLNLAKGPEGDAPRENPHQPLRALAVSHGRRGRSHPVGRG